MRQIHRHALALGLVLALSACGSDPEPQFEADPSPAPSEVTTSAPVKEAWEEKSDDGAIAFVEHWIDEFNAAVLSGDTTVLTELSGSSCTTCENFVSLTDDIYSAGGRVESEGWSIRSLSDPKDSGDGTLVSANFVQPKERIWRSDDSKPEEYPGGPIDYVLTLEWQAGRWQMSAMDVLQ